jgi:hypothetical protein
VEGLLLFRRLPLTLLLVEPTSSRSSTTSFDGSHPPIIWEYKELFVTEEGAQPERMLSENASSRVFVVKKFMVRFKEFAIMQWPRLVMV